MKDSEKYVSVAKVKEKLRYFCRDYGLGGLFKVNAINAINNIKLADVAPVIHCKECKYFEQDTGNYGICTRFNDTTIADDVVKDTDYCSRAKERDEKYNTNRP